MGYADEIVAWYQKKIGSYDKQQWETTVEQRILSGFTHVPKKTARLKTELIDVDLVRGSAFTKAKPKHGVITVLRLAVGRLLLLPIYIKWWHDQTSFRFSILLLLLYSLQILNTILYFTFLSSDDTNERVSASEVLVPFVMMLVLTVIHSLIICTHQSSSKNTHERHNSTTRRIRRFKRRNHTSRGSRSLNFSNEESNVFEAPKEATKFNKRLVSHNSSSDEGGDVSSIRSRRNVAWAATPIKSKAPVPKPIAPDAVIVSQDNEQAQPNLPQVELPRQLEDPNENDPASPTAQDDDGFESLNGNGSSDNNEEEMTLVCEEVHNEDASTAPNSQASCDKATCDIRNFNKNDKEMGVPEITVSSPKNSPSKTPISKSVPQSIAVSKCQERRYSAPSSVSCASCDHKDLADSEGSDGEQPRDTKKILTRRRGSQQTLTVSINSSMAESSFNSESEEGESPESFCPILTEGTTSAGEWIGITTNSEECSYSDGSHSSCEERPPLLAGTVGEKLECDHPFAWEFDHSPNVILSPSCAASDKVSCTMWENKDVKKADLSVLDISSAIIGRVEQMPDNMDYFYTGIFMATLLSFLPSFCRLCAVLIDDDSLGGFSPKDQCPVGSKDQCSFPTQAPPSITSITTPVSFISLLSLMSEWAGFITNAAFSNVPTERYVIMIGFLERLILGGLFFFLLTVAERTFKQRFLYAKFFSHLTSFRRARKSELPHFRLNKVRNIKTWLSVRSYLRKRGPQRSVDVIVSAAFVITLVLLIFLSFEILKDSFRLHSTINVEAMFWCLMLGVFLLRFMTLGTKINHKYKNMSVLITEQINLYLQIEQKPNKKDELMLANSVLKLAADLIKELESPFKISGLSANPYLYTITKVVILSALSGVLSEILGFKLKLHKIKIK